MKLKSLALAVSIISMLILALSSPFLFSSQAKSQNQDPSILMRCIVSQGQGNVACSFTSNTPPSGSQVLLIVYIISGVSCSQLGFSSPWSSLYFNPNVPDDVCYLLSSSSYSFSFTGTNYAVFEVDYISGSPVSINAYATSCSGQNSAGTIKWMAIQNQACGKDTQMLSTSVWLYFQDWSSVSSNVQCYDKYCSLWTPSLFSSNMPIVVGDAGANNNGWDGSAISGNVSAVVSSGGGPNVASGVLVQANPVSLGGNNNGVFATTTTVTQTQTNFVAPSPTSVQYWIIPMFLILGVGALLLMIGRYAGMTGGDTFMLFVLGAWLGSIFGLMANIVPIAIVIVISIVMIFLIWRKVS